MGKLETKHKNYIENNFELSNPKIAQNLFDVFGLEITKEGVRKYKIKCLQQVEVVEPKNLVIPEPVKQKIKTKSKSKSVQSINDLILRLNSNKDHYWYEYLYKQATGKLRSDYQKLFEFIRDTD